MTQTKDYFDIVDIKNFLVKVNDGRQIIEGQDHGEIFIRLDTVEEALIAAVEEFKGKPYKEIREPVKG